MKSLIKFIPTFLACIILLTGCQTYRYIYPNVSGKDRGLKVGILTPNCIIAVIQEGNKLIYDSAATEKAKQKLMDITKETIAIHTSYKSVTTDTAITRMIYQEVFAIGNKLNKAKTKLKKKQVIDSSKISNHIDSLMQVMDVDQLIICYQRGFYRTKTNLRNQNLKGIGVGVLTLGIYTPVPIGARTMLYTWVVDQRRKTVVFSNMNLQETHPLNTQYLRQQVCELYQRFYTANYSNGVCYPL